VVTSLRVHVRQLPGGETFADKVILTPNAAILLDGASAFEPVDVAPDTYAETLAKRIAIGLFHTADIPIPDIVAAAISETTDKLSLRPGTSPSSTVSILRVRADKADLYVLGDSPIHYGTRDSSSVLTDDRLDRIATLDRDRYTSRLRAGHGYDDQHRAALVALQQAQREARNQPGGYWIAETDPDAAHHGITRTLTPDAITWAVLATDGAADFIDHSSDDADWSAIAQYEPVQLFQLLTRIHEWESTTDPDGRIQPRAKRHDDKSLVTVPAIW
jgi:hypothetical protein